MNPWIVLLPMQNVRVYRRLFDSALHPVAEAVFEIVQANLCILVIGIYMTRFPLAVIDQAATIESEIWQAVHEEELVVCIGLGQVPRAPTIFMDVIWIADQAHVGFPLPETQGF